MSTHDGVYLFCAIHEKEPKKFGSVQLNGKKGGVYTIHFENVAMVVSKVTGDVLPTRPNLMAHQQKITEVMKQYTVIPMSFGNVFHSKNDVLLIMEHLNEEFENLFSQLDNKMEVGLKVIPKKEWINEEMKKIHSYISGKLQIKTWKIQLLFMTKYRWENKPKILYYISRNRRQRKFLNLC